MNTPNPVADPSHASSAASDVADRLSNAADQTVKKARGVVNDKFDQTENAIHSARDRAEPILDRLGEQAEAIKQRSADALRQSRDYVRDVTARTSERTAAYVQEQPLKAVLLAAAGGALLAILASAALRRRGERG